MGSNFQTVLETIQREYDPRDAGYMRRKLQGVAAMAGNDVERAKVELMLGRVECDARNWVEANDAAKRALDLLVTRKGVLAGQAFLIRAQALYKLGEYQAAEAAALSALENLGKGSEDYAAAQWGLSYIQYEMEKRNPTLTWWGKFKLWWAGPQRPKEFKPA